MRSGRRTPDGWRSGHSRVPRRGLAGLSAVVLLALVLGVGAGPNSGAEPVAPRSLVVGCFLSCPGSDDENAVRTERCVEAVPRERAGVSRGRADGSLAEAPGASGGLPPELRARTAWAAAARCRLDPQRRFRHEGEADSPVRPLRAQSLRGRLGRLDQGDRVLRLVRREPVPGQRAVCGPAPRRGCLAQQCSAPQEPVSGRLARAGARGRRLFRTFERLGTCRRLGERPGGSERLTANESSNDTHARREVEMFRVVKLPCVAATLALAAVLCADAQAVGHDRSLAGISECVPGSIHGTANRAALLRRHRRQAPQRAPGAHGTRSHPVRTAECERRRDGVRRPRGACRPFVPRDALQGAAPRSPERLDRLGARGRRPAASQSEPASRSTSPSGASRCSATVGPFSSRRL